jgi:hypothetical protein
MAAYLEYAAGADARSVIAPRVLGFAKLAALNVAAI